MPLTICIVGRPDSGKTTLIGKLIPELKNRGYRVATIKHALHDFDLEQEGKDSWHHARAGSECIILSSQKKVAITQYVDHDLQSDELVRFVSEDFDIVIAEGFKHSHELKIEVYRQEMGEPICEPKDVIARVSDDPLESDGLRFPPADISGITDLIEQNIKSHKEVTEVALFVDGKSVPLTFFVRSLLTKTIDGMVSSLKGVERPRRLNISITKR